MWTHIIDFEFLHFFLNDRNNTLTSNYIFWLVWKNQLYFWKILVFGGELFLVITIVGGGAYLIRAGPLKAAKWVEPTMTILFLFAKTKYWFYPCTYANITKRTTVTFVIIEGLKSRGIDLSLILVFFKWVTISFFFFFKKKKL